MQLGLLIFGCLVVAVVFRRRITTLVAIALGLRTLVPSVAAVAFTGHSSQGQLQPASYFVIAATLATLFTHFESVKTELRSHRIFYASLLFVFFAATIVASFTPGTSLLVLFDTLGCGTLLCLLIRTAIVKSASNGKWIACAFLAFACAQAIIAILQRVTGSTLLWETYMASYYWWSPTVTRATGTVGAWLDLATLLAVAIPLSAAIRRVWLRLLVIALLIIGIVLSQGRTALVVAAVCLMLLLFTSTMQMGTRIVSAGAVAVGAWILSTSDIFADIAGRFDADAVSTSARNQALDFVISHLPSQPWYGAGFGSNGSTRSMGLISSFENGYLMYVWDIGIPFTLMLVIALASPLFDFRRSLNVPGSWLSLAAAMFLIASFSGFQTPGPTSWVVLAAVGLCARKTRSLPSSATLIDVENEETYPSRRLRTAQPPH